MKKSLLLLVTFSFLLLGCGEDDSDDDNTQTIVYDDNTQTIVHDAIREYVLYVPMSYDGTSEVPFLFYFHGYGGNVNEFMKYADMRSLAESETFILIYPQGSILSDSGYSHWNACPPSGENKSNVDDFGFVESIIYEIASQYSVDMERIYAAGFSNGGMMAYGLANYKSDLIAAVASVSGTMPYCTGPTNHPMPVVHLHGTSDDVVPYNGKSNDNSVQSTLNHWINFNNTTTNPTVSNDNSGGMPIEHYVYEQGDNSVSVEHYKFIGGGHYLFDATYQGQNTAELVWNFVSRYDINGLR